MWVREVALNFMNRRHQRKHRYFFLAHMLFYWSVISVNIHDSALTTTTIYQIQNHFSIFGTEACRKIANKLRLFRSLYVIQLNLNPF